MPSNEERREVAARLRTVTREDTRLVFTEEILSALIGGFTVTEENEADTLLVINRLADLIEPEDRTCRNIMELWFNFECSACGCNVEGGDELGHNNSAGAFKFCPNCGARVKEGR